MANLFQVKNVIKKYQNGEKELFALNNVTVNIPENQITVILGPSGSGKTTLLNILSGLDSVNSGEIIFEEKEDLVKLKDKEKVKYRRDKIGFIFQSYNLISTLTVRENVELGAYLSKNPLDIDDILKQVGLEEHVNKYPHQLSGGQQQRVAIARVIVKNPKVIFCDEPTGALDEESGRKVLSLLEELHKKYHTTLIMVTHNPNIAHMSNNIIKFSNGKIQENYINEDLKSAYEIEWA